jgi:succinoglycan biosynthesis transport protein ExoP
MPAARYVTLSDYLRVLRRFWILIVLLTAFGAAAGLADAERQKATYQASAEIGFQDPVEDLNIVGLGSSTFQTPAQIAAINAETASSPSVSREASALLDPTQRMQLSTSSISASVSASNGLLELTATSSHQAFAAVLANTVAGVLVAQDNAQVKQQFRQVVGDIQRRVAALTRRSKSSPSAVAAQLAFYEDELARLQTVAAFARTAQLSRMATVPSGPSSPDRVRSLSLGLIIGLLLGILAAFVRDSTDRRLRSIQDVTECLPFPIVGRVRDRGMGQVLRVSDASDKEGWADFEAFRILRRNVEALPAADGGCTLLVTSAMPEEGKSTVASSLALAMASAGKTTLLVDCDLRRPSMATRLEIPGAPGLTDYLSGEASPEEILRSVPLAQSLAGMEGALANQQNGGPLPAAVPKFVCIPAGSTRRNTPELLGSERFRVFIDQIRTVYDVVIIDSSPLLPVSDTLEIIPHVDMVLMCVRYAQTRRDQAEAARVAIARFPDRPTGLVITGLKPRSADSELYSYSYDYS